MITSLFAVIVSSSSVAAQTQPAVVPPAIERVVVFADRAEVTRATVARCENGAASAVFVALPESIDPRTLRGEAEGDAVAVGVSSDRVALEQALDERVRGLQKELLDIDDRLSELARAQDDDNQRSRSLQSYATYFRALASEEMRSEKPDASRWDKILDALTNDGNKQAVDNVARAAEQRVLNRKRERLVTRLSRLQPAQAPASINATVSVQCGKDPSPRVRLSYVVPGASWQPEYDLRFTGPAKRRVGEGHATVGVAGVVTQSSGEDWTDAEVWLSTSKPSLGGEAPLPNPISVSGYEEKKQKTLVQTQEHRADDLRAGVNTGAASPAGFEDGGKSFTLKIKGKVTVHADGRPYWFPVEEVGGNARSVLVAQPQLSPYVFQVAKLVNPAPYPLLAGRMHVFRGATFVGDVNTPYKAPGEPMEISLGVDDEVQFERQDLLKQKREAGLLSGSQTVAHAYRTVLHNRSDDDVDVEVREQIPVSKSADIDVKVENDKTSPGFTLDKLRGHLVWAVALKRGNDATRDIAFTIALPKDWAVQ